MKLTARLNAVMALGLPMRIKGVLWVLARRADDDTSKCHTSMKRLADDAGCSISVAQRAVRHLEELHIVTPIRHPRRVTHFLVDLRAVRLTDLPGRIERLNGSFNPATNQKRLPTPCISCKKLIRSSKPPTIAKCRPCLQLDAADREATPSNVRELFPEAKASP